MILYIIKVSLILTASYWFYKLLLEEETFFDLHRWYFIFCLLLSFTLPLVEMPNFYQGQENWSIVPTGLDQQISQGFGGQSTTPIPPTNELESSTLTPNEQTIASSSEHRNQSNFNVVQIAFYLYLFGLFIFGSILIIQLITILYAIKKSKNVIKDGKVYIVDIDKDKSPHSFLNFIFISPEKYDWETYNQILEHEKIHVSQRHTLDIVLAELMVVVQWFNPFAWMYRKVVENNLEFLTDAKMVKSYDHSNRETYQLNLLKVAVPNFPLGITTNFNQSLIKKRIKMINSKKSSISNIWKYPFILPVFALFMLLLNDNAHAQTDVATDLPKDMDKEFAAEFAESFAKEFTKDFANMNFDDMNEMNPELDDQVLDGAWDAKVEDGRVCFNFHDGDKNTSTWHVSRCFSMVEIGMQKNGKNSPFDLQRAPGKILFDGTINADQGNGTYQFQVDESFKNYLKNNGIQTIGNGDLFFAFMSDINKEYIEYIKANNYNPSELNLPAFAGLGIDLPTLKDHIGILKEAGHSSASLEKIMVTRSLNINRTYIQSLKDKGYDQLSLDDLIAGRSMGIDATYVQSMKDKHNKLFSFQELIAMKSNPFYQPN